MEIESTTFTLRRKLSPSQQVRRQRILDVAMTLAAEGGEDAVQMKTVAARARVSLGTIYRDFASKDHLLGEALLVWGNGLGARLRAWPPKGKTAAARVGSVFRRISKALGEKPALRVALTAALLSRDPSAETQREELTGMLGEWMDLALGEDELPGRADGLLLLSHVGFSMLLRVAQGETPPRELGDVLERAANRLFAGDRS